MTLPQIIILCYLSVISLISVVVCVYDKAISRKNRVELRIPEKTLLVLSALGGSVAMFVTMQLIRHKTKHAKFMVGIPVIIVLQILLVIGIMYLRTFINFQ